MQISLNEAIDIYARVMMKRHGKVAVIASRQWAADRKALGDLEGEQVCSKKTAPWRRINSGTIFRDQTRNSCWRPFAATWPSRSRANTCRMQASNVGRYLRKAAGRRCYRGN
jgi:hypothetical protein